MYYLVEAVAKEERLLFSTTRPTAENIFAIQTEVAERIAEELNAVLPVKRRRNRVYLMINSSEGQEMSRRVSLMFRSLRM